MTSNVLEPCTEREIARGSHIRRVWKDLFFAA